MKYALVVAVLCAATPAFAGRNPFFAGFGQGWMQSQQSSPREFHFLGDRSNTFIPPIPPIPPVGASSCYPIRICDVTGRQCIWQEVCR